MRLKVGELRGTTAGKYGFDLGRSSKTILCRTTSRGLSYSPTFYIYGSIAFKNILATIRSKYTNRNQYYIIESTMVRRTLNSANTSVSFYMCYITASSET